MKAVTLINLAFESLCRESGIELDRVMWLDTINADDEDYARKLVETIVKNGAELSIHYEEYDNTVYACTRYGI